VRENERIDEKTRALFAKLAHPVMTDLTLAIDGLAPTQLVPAKLPDLFAGDRLEVFGRYAARARTRSGSRAWSAACGASSCTRARSRARRRPRPRSWRRCGPSAAWACCSTRSA
jgi:hypothetical protein